MNKTCLFILAWLISSCQLKDPDETSTFNQNTRSNAEQTICEIRLPHGFARVNQETGSFGEWLRLLRLKKDNRVYLFNGTLKRNQNVHYAVVDLPIGKKDLQQCADVVMRLRAQYLFDSRHFYEISFADNNGKRYDWTGNSEGRGFEHYLENVYGWCGSASLEKQMNPLSDIRQFQPGDVLIKGGFPGHAMIVADVAMNVAGEKIFLLVQGYTPAQDIHVVRNPDDLTLSPWYKVTDDPEIHTPEWLFYKNQLKRW